jgi:hypothetical protein
MQATSILDKIARQADSVCRNWMLPSASAVAGLVGHSSLFCR